MSAWRAVFWSFLGVRKGGDLDKDALRLKPMQIIVAGILGAAALVLALLGLVHFVTAKS